MQRASRLTFLIIITFVISSCSTQKNRWTSRNYHKMCAHYNAYFNGNESMKEGVAQLNKSVQDNYMKILPVYKIGTEKDGQSVAGSMDKSITKSSLVIKRHSMIFNKKEVNPWIGKSYLMIGKANYYKQNYLASKQTFEYIISHYKNEPVKNEASLWLARTYNQMHQYQKSEPQIALVRNAIEKSHRKIHLIDKIMSPFVRRDIPIEVYKDLPLVFSDYFIQQGNYLPAIEHLKKGIEMNRKRKVRARLTFILAQIYQQKGELRKATRYYHNVMKLNPPYEMAFNCKMNLAKCYDASSANGRSIKKVLLKMTKDIKNKDYLDQIYYALAEISLKEKNTTEALKYLKLSAATSKTNNNQKAITYLKIADIYYAQADYVPAQPYYDSTMTVLPADFPDYTKIQDKKNTLNNLVKNLNTVHLEDSLQLLAHMSEKERNAAIDKLIRDYLKKEEEKRQAEINKQINQTYYTSNPNMNPNASGSSAWYFYNSNSISFGISDFVKKWGNRPLEDNWILSNKKQVAFANAEESKSDSATSDTSKTSGKSFNPKDKKSYLNNIPLTAEKMKESNQKIEEALYNLGFIWDEGLKEYQKSVESFEDLLKRYPDTKFVLSSYYQLYKIYSDELHDNSKAEHYKNILLTKYGDSDYAMMIKDPNYVANTKTAKNEASSLYSDTYQAYIDAQYNTVLENSNKALLAYKGNNLLPKFDLLRAYCIGKTSDIKSFTTALNEIVTKYPNNKVKTEAQNVLDYIANKDKKDKSPQTTDHSPQKAYTFEASPESIHFYVMIADMKDVNLKDVKNAISDFDKQQFSLDNLNISSSVLGTDKQVITVSNFDGQDNGMRYFNAIKDNKDVMASLKQAKCEQYIISVDNYTALFKNKDLKSYSKFFEENYGK
jgi:tetratricopeptide (TPR) repeat protein